MAQLTFERAHQLGEAQARQRMEGLADEMQATYRLKSHWDGNVLQFSRPGISGQIVVSDSAICLNARVGPILAAFLPRIEAQLDKNFAAYFG